MNYSDPNTQVGALGGSWNRKTHEALYGENLNTGLGDFLVQIVAPSDFMEFGSGLGALASYVTARTAASPAYCIEPTVESLIDPHFHLGFNQY